MYVKNLLRFRGAFLLATTEPRGRAETSNLVTIQRCGSIGHMESDLTSEPRHQMQENGVKRDRNNGATHML